MGQIFIQQPKRRTVQPKRRTGHPTKGTVSKWRTNATKKSNLKQGINWTIGM
jgi:hypothetical protein